MFSHNFLQTLKIHLWNRCKYFPLCLPGLRRVNSDCTVETSTELSSFKPCMPRSSWGWDVGWRPAKGDGVHELPHGQWLDRLSIVGWLAPLSWLLASPVLSKGQCQILEESTEPRFWLCPLRVLSTLPFVLFLCLFCFVLRKVSH